MLFGLVYMVPLTAFTTYGIVTQLTGGRVPMTYLIAEPSALPALVDHLQLKPAESGANVEILIPDEAELFDDLRQPAPDLWTTSPLQTFLDLGTGGERGQEAADHLLASVSQW